MRNFILSFIISSIALQVGLRSLVAYADGKRLSIDCSGALPICFQRTTR